MSAGKRAHRGSPRKPEAKPDTRKSLLQFSLSQLLKFTGLVAVWCFASAATEFHPVALLITTPTALWDNGTAAARRSAGSAGRWSHRYCDRIHLPSYRSVSYWIGYGHNGWLAFGSMDQKPVFCPETVVTCCCLGFQALVFAVAAMLPAAIPESLDALLNLLLIISTGVGFGCGLSAARHMGWPNRAVGAVGMLWFLFIVAVAAVSAFSLST